MLARLQSQALVAHILKCDNLTTYLLLRELTAWNGAVLCVIRAVDTAIDAVVREVQRGKHHNTVAVDTLLEVACNGVHTLLYLLVLHLDEYCSLAV